MVPRVFARLFHKNRGLAPPGFYSLLCHAADSKPVVLAAAVRRVDSGRIQAQAVRVARTVRRTRPVVAAAALIVGTATEPVARQDESWVTAH